MTQLLKRNIENLYPSFTVGEILRQNVYKKTIIIKRNNRSYILRLFNLEFINKEKVTSIIKILNKLS
jgi:NIMA (never in mitosis gene a)-related kinase